MLIEPPATLAWRGPAGQRVPLVPPLGVTSVAAVLEARGFEVTVLDALAEGYLTPTRTTDDSVRIGLTDAQIAARIADFAPDVVGVSCVLSNRHHDAHAVCRIAKQVSPRILTVMGGAHPTTLTDLVMADPAVDIAVLGEGDLALPGILERLDAGLPLTDLDGLACRVNGTVHVTDKTNYITELDELPFPARHLLDLERYWEVGQPHGDLKRRRFATMVTSRGCPGRCIYCSAEKLWGKRYRLRSAENVLAEMEYLIERFGVEEIHFEDDNLTASKARTRALLGGMIERGFDLAWSTPNGLMIETLDDEIIELMAASGCYATSLAVESGSQRVLTDVVRKKLDLTRVKPLVATLRASGIHTRGFFVIGFPGETRDEIGQTIEFAAEAGFDWATINIATPLPGTDMHRVCVENGYIDADLALGDLKYTIGSITTDEFDPAYLHEQWRRADEYINYENNTNVREGRYDTAIADFERVGRLYPGHATVFGHLARAYDAAGRPGDADKARTRAANNDPLQRRIGGEFEIDDALLTPETAPHRLGPHFASGRGALRAVLDDLRSKRDIATILLPDYLCESIITTVSRAGFAYDFYSVTENLTPDAASLAAALSAASEPTAVLLVDYFGIVDLSASIAWLRAHDASIPIMLDAVQAPLRDDAMRGADYAFTSLRKALPVPDGALALSRAGALVPAGATEAAFVAGKLSGLLLKTHASREGLPDATFLQLLEIAEHQLDEVGYYDSPMSDISRRILGHLATREIAASRRANFERLRDRLAGFDISPLADLGPDSVPLFLPIAIEDRDRVRSELARQRIYCPVHWPVPETDDREPLDERQPLYATELSLVIDQRYGSAEMDRIAEALREAMGR
jgi:magnesium-protoporphyrin IX monomethyl ester (oxidative) cyclase